MFVNGEPLPGCPVSDQGWGGQCSNFLCQPPAPVLNTCDYNARNVVGDFSNQRYYLNDTEAQYFLQSINNVQCSGPINDVPRFPQKPASQFIQALPCRQTQEWDYNSMCYNVGDGPCQFTNVVDLEDFM